MISKIVGYQTNNSNHTVPYSRKRVYASLYILVLLLLNYSLQDFLTSANTFVSVGSRSGVHATLIIMIVFLSIYYLFTFLREMVFSPVKFSLWLITFWIAITYISQSNYEWSSVIRFGFSSMWLLIYHFFSYLMRRHPSSLKQVKMSMAIMFVFYVFSSVCAMFYIHNHLVKVGDDRMAVVNLAYNVVVFLPWILLVKRKKIRNFFLLMALLVVLGSMKRGAIIIYPLMISTWILLNGFLETGKIARSIVFILLSTVLFSIGLFAFDQISDGFLSQRFSLEQLEYGSGRGQALLIAFDEIQKWSLVEIILGVGRGFFSHNDWFEFLYCFGLVGVLLYAQLFVSLGWELFQLIRKSSQLSPLYAMTILYMAVVGLFGAIYFVHSTLFVMAFLGTVEGLNINNERKNIKYISNKWFSNSNGAWR